MPENMDGGNTDTYLPNRAEYMFVLLITSAVVLFFLLQLQILKCPGEGEKINID